MREESEQPHVLGVHGAGERRLDLKGCMTEERVFMGGLRQRRYSMNTYWINTHRGRRTWRMPRMQVDWNEREDAEDSGGHWSGDDTGVPR